MAEGRYKEWLTKEGLMLLQGWKRDGLTDEQIAEKIGIKRPTLYDWKKKYPDISDALKRGKETVNFAVENALLKKALSGNTTAIIFWLKNNWRDKYNDSELSPEEIENLKSKRRVTEAQARIYEKKAELLENVDKEQATQLEKILDKLTEEVLNSGTERPDDTETD